MTNYEEAAIKRIAQLKGRAIAEKKSWYHRFLKKNTIVHRHPYRRPHDGAFTFSAQEEEAQTLSHLVTEGICTASVEGGYITFRAPLTGGRE